MNILVTYQSLYQSLPLEQYSSSEQALAAALLAEPAHGVVYLDGGIS